MNAPLNYNTLALAVSMQPGRGVQFSRRECRLEFGPKGEQEPIIHTISPTSEWHHALSWGSGVRLSLDGELKWHLHTPHLAEGELHKNCLTLWRPAGFSSGVVSQLLTSLRFFEGDLFARRDLSTLAEAFNLDQR